MDSFGLNFTHNIMHAHWICMVWRRVFVSAVAQSRERVHWGFWWGLLGSRRPQKLKLTHAQSPVLELWRNMQLGKEEKDFFLSECNSWSEANWKRARQDSCWMCARWRWPLSEVFYSLYLKNDNDISPVAWKIQPTTSEKRCENRKFNVPFVIISFISSFDKIEIYGSVCCM